MFLQATLCLCNIASNRDECCRELYKHNVLVDTIPILHLSDAEIVHMALCLVEMILHTCPEASSSHDYTPFPLSPIGGPSITVTLCLYVRLSVRWHISKTTCPNFTKLSVHGHRQRYVWLNLPDGVTSGEVAVYDCMLNVDYI